MVAGLLLLAGCGPSADAKKGATVKGKLLSDGSALESSPTYVPGEKNVRLMVALRDEKGGSGGGATVNSDGTFAMEEVKPGKYRLTVEHYDMGLVPESKGTSGATPGKPAVGPGKPTGGAEQTNDRLKGKFSLENTQMSVTVPEDKAEHDLGTIDLAKDDTWPKQK